MMLAMIALTLFLIAMIASYSGAFAKPTLHHMAVAVAGPEQVVDGIRGQNELAVNVVGDDAGARRQVYERKADAAYVIAPTGEMTIYVAGGGGRSVATAAETVGREIAAKAGLTATVADVAPASAGDPSGTVEFYAIIFISIGASVGATVGLRTHHGHCAQARDACVAHRQSGGILGTAGRWCHPLRRPDSGGIDRPSWQVFGALWLYAMAVGGAVTGVAAAFGTLASMAPTLFLVIIGNAAAAGPVGRPLLSGFYSTFTAIVPQGSGVSLLRSVQYFGGNGAQTPLVTLAIWGAAGCVLAANRHRRADCRTGCAAEVWSSHAAA